MLRKNADETVDGTEKPLFPALQPFRKRFRRKATRISSHSLKTVVDKLLAGSKSADEDSGYKVVTVNGVERLLLRNPDGTCSSADENGGLAKSRLTAKTLFLSDAKPKPVV